MLGGVSLFPLLLSYFVGAALAQQPSTHSKRRGKAKARECDRLQKGALGCKKPAIRSVIERAKKISFILQTALKFRGALP
jgi:hypothetical protein